MARVLLDWACEYSKCVVIPKGRLFWNERLFRVDGHFEWMAISSGWLFRVDGYSEWMADGNFEWMVIRITWPLSRQI